MHRLLLFVGVLSLSGLLITSTLGAPGYRLAGDYFETCSCDPACPCVFLSDPTQGHCNATLVWHIREGNYGEVSLSGLNVVVVTSAGGNMHQTLGQWRTVLYVDERATAEQRDALAKVYAVHFGEMLRSMAGPKPVPIEFAREDGDRYRVRIPGILDAATEPIIGPEGVVASIHHAPLKAIEPMKAGRSVRHRYTDSELDSWDYGAGRNAYFGAFDYTPSK